MMNIIKVIPIAFDVLRKGKALSNAAAWKNVQAVLLFIAALDALAKSIGYDFGFTNDDYAIIANFIVYAVSIYLVFATSDKVGFREKTITPPSQGGPAEANYAEAYLDAVAVSKWWISTLEAVTKR